MVDTPVVYAIPTRPTPGRPVILTNTWYPCTIVDANDKEVPCVDCNGKALSTVDERCVVKRSPAHNARRPSRVSGDAGLCSKLL
jgi:hypothetical protein